MEELKLYFIKYCSYDPKQRLSQRSKAKKQLYT
jgi:hypothetical protein